MIVKVTKHEIVFYLIIAAYKFKKTLTKNQVAPELVKCVSDRTFMQQKKSDRELCVKLLLLVTDFPSNF